MKLHFKLIFIVSAILFSSVNNARPDVIDALPMDGFAAVVNERVITIGDVMLSTYEAQERLRLKYSGDELKSRREELFYAGLERIIDQVLIVEEFNAQQGKIPDRVIDERVNAIVYENFENDKPTLLAALAKDGITLDEWRETIHERIIVGAMQQNEIGNRVVISPKQIVDAYDNSSSRYTQKEQVKLRLIFVKSGNSPDKAFERIDEARKTILNDGSFEDVAKSISEDATAAIGGDWGWVEPGEMRGELRSALENLPVKKISEPIYTPEGYYLVQIDEKREAQTKTLPEVRNEIENELRESESERLYKDWMTRLRLKHSIMYFIPRPPDQP